MLGYTITTAVVIKVLNEGNRAQRIKLPRYAVLRSQQWTPVVIRVEA